MTGTWDGSTVSLYQNGVLVGSAAQSADASPAYDLTIGGALGYGEGYLDGSLDEARVSGIARSADWIAAEYSNQSAPSSFYALSTENGFFLSPSTVALNASQSQQFTATGLCNLGVSWSMPVGSPGTLAPDGVYTAPNVITAAQTVMVTATSQTDVTIATATITLLPPVTISLTPGSVTLTGDQTQQFTANVADTNNTAVTWTITPDGTGAIDAYGCYTAPSTIGGATGSNDYRYKPGGQHQVRTAVITLAPSECVSNGYGYQRVIVIDHTKVSNTDQINFPFLFSTTDLDLATTDNGGHVTSLYGYDIFFSTDPNGQTKLDHELEEYNPSNWPNCCMDTHSHALSRYRHACICVLRESKHYFVPAKSDGGVEWQLSSYALSKLLRYDHYKTDVKNGKVTKKVKDKTTGKVSNVTMTDDMLYYWVIQKLVGIHFLKEQPQKEQPLKK